MEWPARLGLIARGVVYLVVGWLALLVARGRDRHEADRTGALATIARQPFGTWLLLLLAVGFAGYVVWRSAEAVTGRTATTSDAGLVGRLAAAARAALYAAFTLSTLKYAVTHHGSSGSERQQTLTAHVLGWRFGTWLVGAAGLAVVAAGTANLWRAVSGKFLDKLQMQDLGRVSERTVRVTGTVGYGGRGVAFALVGLFAVQAAVDYDPDKSRGLDGALHQLAHRSYGPPCLVVLAVALAAFGAYSLMEARWRRVR